MNLRKSCNGCIHRRPLSTKLLRETACHYLLDTGEPRGCPASRCTLWQDAPTPWLHLLHSIAGGRTNGR